MNNRIQTWLRNLQVQQKITWGYGLSLGIAITGTSLGIILADQQQRHAEALAKDALEELKLLTRLQVDVLEVLIQQDQVEEALFQPDRAPNAYIQWLENFRRFQYSWEEFKETENHTAGEEEVESTEELAALDSFFNQHETHLDKYIQAFSRLSSSPDTIAFSPNIGIHFRTIAEQLNQGGFSEQSYAVNSDLTELTFIIREEYEVAQIAINNASTLRLWLISASMTVSVVLASVLSILTSRAIAHPIYTLTLMTQQLSKGNVSIRIPVNSNDEVGQLSQAFNQMAEQLTESGLLSQQIQELQHTLGELKLNQAKLIHAEKMSSLGQLVAGVAHELNTPLGAIQSSISNISDALKQTLHALPPMLQSLPPDHRSDFFTLLDWAQKPQALLSSREERQLKRSIQQSLTEHSVLEADMLADTLSKMAITVPLHPILPLLQAANAFEVLETAYQLSIIQNNSLNIQLAVGQATRIVYALKNYVRQDVSGVPVYASVSEGIDTVLALHQNQLKHGIQIEKSFSDLPKILCYPEELIQVWSNLMSNAIQAMNYKGKLAIATAATDQHILVQFTDSGTGIPLNIQARIFDPFFTTKAMGEGTGLGLSIVKNIIDKHRGQIEVRSVPGRTIFNVWLPLNILLDEKNKSP